MLQRTGAAAAGSVSYPTLGGKTSGVFKTSEVWPTDVIYGQNRNVD